MVLGRLPLYGEPEVLPDRSQASSLSAEELVVAYHERTKHHYHRFAASVGYMDWATQPDPFRRYHGASLVRLPFPEMGQALPYWHLYVADSMEPAPLSIDSVSLFFCYALSLTAWKRFHETTWSLRSAAAALAWKLFLLDRVGAMSQLLGLNRDADYAGAEREHPELLAVVVRGNWASDRGLCLSKEVASQGAASRWYGTANVLSPEHSVDWPVIDEVAGATTTPTTAIDEDFSEFPAEGELFEPPVRSGAFTAKKVILGRRSAVSMDASTAISAAMFFRMLARLVPTRDGRSVPWDAIPWRPRIHLGLFVHRVNDLSPGLYTLARDPEKVEPLRQAMRREFLWRRPPSCPRGLPLYLLKEGDCRALAASVSCGQDIAGDGAFSLGMIADYMDSLITYGAAFYRNLFWEAGLVGQV